MSRFDKENMSAPHTQNELGMIPQNESREYWNDPPIGREFGAQLSTGELIGRAVGILSQWTETGNEGDPMVDCLLGVIREVHCILSLLPASTHPDTQKLDRLRATGIAEIAAINPNVMEYMNHWEGRAERAETRVAELEAREAAAVAAVDKADAWDAISAKNAEIARITAERDRQYDENVHRIAEQAKAESERDDTLSKLAVAFEAAASIIDACNAKGPHLAIGAAPSIRALTPSDAATALDHMLTQAKAEGRKEVWAEALELLPENKWGGEYETGWRMAVCTASEAILAAAEKEAGK